MKRLSVLLGMFLLLSAFTASFAKAECARPPAVLIPGFFDLFGTGAPPPLSEIGYFSNAILAEVQRSGFEPIVLQNLEPLANIAINGQHVREALEAIAVARPGCQLTLITHSSGGIYTAYALDKNPNLPVKQVVTLSAPYNGSALTEIADLIPNWGKFAGWLNLASLTEFGEDNMRAVVSGFRLPRVRWVALAASQPGCFLLNCTDPRRLNSLLSAIWFPTMVEGDGLVSVDSALGTDLRMTATDGRAFKMERWNLHIPLNHWETTLDARLFRLLGVGNVAWIEQQQISLYREILRRLR